MIGFFKFYPIRLKTSLHRTLFYFNGRRKDSQWIYSTKHQQQQFRKPGSIALYAHINHDTHNASLRFIEHIENASMVFTNSPAKVHKYLQAIGKKQRFAYDTQISDQKSKELQIQVQNTSLQSIKQQWNKKSFQLQTELQISKFIELEKETNKQKKQTNNKYLAEQSKQLKSFMAVKFMESELNEIKSKQGYPAIIQIKDNIAEIEKIQKDGFNIVFAFCDDENNIVECGEVVKELEKKKMAYEILPCTDQLITAIVSSGLPADRFSIQSYPNENIEALLVRRANMKITTCIEIQTQRLDDLVKAVVKILGKQHIIYLHGEKEQFYRGEAIGLQTYLNQHFPQTKTVYMVIAPKIPQFNQGLKAELNVKSHIIGELHSEKINIVEMEILVKKLDEMDKREQIYQIDTYLMAAELLARIQNDNTVRQCLRKLFPRKKQNQIEKILEEGKKKVFVDHIGFTQPLKKDKKMLEQ